MGGKHHMNEKIRSLRIEKGLSEKEMANILGITPYRLMLLEEGSQMPNENEQKILLEQFGFRFEMPAVKEELPDTEAVERISFRITKDELAPSLKKINFMSWRRMFYSMIIIVLLLVYAYLMHNETTKIMSTTTLLAFSSAFITLLFRQKKINKESLLNIPQREYRYTFFRKYMIVDIFKEDEHILMERIPYEQIDAVYDTPVLIFLHYRNRSYLIKKDVLAENSIVNRFIATHPKNKVIRSKK